MPRILFIFNVFLNKLITLSKTKKLVARHWPSYLTKSWPLNWSTRSNVPSYHCVSSDKMLAMRKFSCLWLDISFFLFVALVSALLLCCTAVSQRSWARVTSQSTANTTVIASQHPLETSTGRREREWRQWGMKHAIRVCMCERLHVPLTGKEKRRKKESGEGVIAASILRLNI